MSEKNQKYLSIEELIEMIDEPNRSKSFRLLNENKNIFKSALGGTHNHHAWRGGYLNHLIEVMNTALILYQTLNDVRPLPFSLSDSLYVLYLHDLEKPWRFELNDEGEFVSKSEFGTWRDQHSFRVKKLLEFNIELNENIEQAIKYIEGEHGEYTEKRRIMSPLAAFCHTCDTLSARVWFDYPLQENDPWQGAKR